MRTHIENDIYISGSLGYNIERRVMRDVKDKETKEVTHQEEFFDTEKHYVTLGGAINGLLHHKVTSLSDKTVLELRELAALIKDHKDFIESQIAI